MIKGYVLMTKMDKNVRRQFVANCRGQFGSEHLKYLLDEDFNSFAELVIGAFVWRRTPEGFDYWNNIAIKG